LGNLLFRALLRQLSNLVRIGIALQECLQHELPAILGLPKAGANSKKNKIGLGWTADEPRSTQIKAKQSFRRCPIGLHPHLLFMVWLRVWRAVSIRGPIPFFHLSWYYP
jgi:hypothetical protein